MKQLLIFALAGLLTACGGGGSDEESKSTDHMAVNAVIQPQVPPQK